MKKYVNTLTVRNSEYKTGNIEIIFAEKEDNEVLRALLQGKKKHIEGWQFMTFQYDGRNKLWWAKETAMLNKQLTKYVSILKENGYKVADMRKSAKKVKAEEIKAKKEAPKVEAPAKKEAPAKAEKPTKKPAKKEAPVSDNARLDKLEATTDRLESTVVALTEAMTTLANVITNQLIK